ncbi:hypothetical protein UlMin_043073 [Ulmus minor]
MGKSEKAEERREQRRQEISLLIIIPYSDQQRWSSAETIVVVTGGNRGIGFEILRQLLVHGLTVILTSRDPNVSVEAAKALQEVGFNVAFHQLDVLDLCLSTTLLIGFTKTMAVWIFWLVNNAGVNFNVGNENSVEHAQMVVATNYFGTKNMIQALIPLMKPSTVGARIVNRIGDLVLRRELSDVDSLSEELIDRTIFSFLQQVEEGTWESGGWPQTFTEYSISKLAVNAYTRLMVKTLSDMPEGHKIYINCFCPGLVKTYAGNIPTEEAADTRVWLALLPDLSVTGMYFCRKTQNKHLTVKEKPKLTR